MFSNLRSTAVLVFGVIVILTLFFAVYFKSSMIRGIVSEDIEEKGTVISKAYNNSVWDKYSPVIDYVYSLDEAERESITQFALFSRESESFFQIDNLAKVIVYSDNADILFDSKPRTAITPGSDFLDSVFLGNTDVDKAQTEALTGKASMAILTGGLVVSAGSEKEESIIKIFVPIKSQISKGGTKSSVNGIVELNFIVSDVIGFLSNIQFVIIVSVLGVATSIIMVLFYSSKKAEEVMEKQQEASVEMSAAKAMAESESRAKSQFLANVSHELRTPLNAIIGFSEIINNESMGPVGNEEYKEFIQDIHTSGVHLLSLINDILDFSKAEENKLSVEFEQIDITKLVKICMRMVLPRAENAKVSLRDEIPTEHFVLMADQKRLKQVILNLLSNAVKFTQEGGEVLTRVWKDIATNSIVIEVKDTGVGMAPQDLARALSPFGQVDNKLSRRYEGTGLGLPLTKKLVELMRGKFDIRSEVGLGTTVLLYFPLQDSDMQDISEYREDISNTTAVASEKVDKVADSPPPIEEVEVLPEPEQSAEAPQTTEEIQAEKSEQIALDQDLGNAASESVEQAQVKPSEDPIEQNVPTQSVSENVTVPNVDATPLENIGPKEETVQTSPSVNSEDVAAPMNNSNQPMINDGSKETSSEVVQSAIEEGEKMPPQEKPKDENTQN